MKILYIHTQYIQRGGEDVVYENELKLMEQAGHEVRSLLFNNKKYSALKFLLFLFNPFSFVKTWRTIGSFRPDIVHVQNWFFGASPSVFIAARWRKVPVVHTIHNFRILCPSSFLFFKNEIFIDCVTKVFPYEAIRKKVYRNSAFNTFWLLAGTRLHHFLGTWKKIDTLICLTDTARKVLSDSYLHLDVDRIVIKPNFFGADEVPGNGKPAKARSGHFLYVGRLAPEKGINMMLEAFKDSPFSLRIIGEGPLRADVEKVAAENKNICYLGFQNKDRIVQELSLCNALVFATIGYEQFGMVIIEAFFCGTPVIGPDTGSPSELITNGVNGLHFHTGSSSDLLEKMKYWRSVPQHTWDSFSQSAVKTYQQYYTPQNNLQQLLTIYKTTIA